jgi:hypothetical protein
LPRFFGGTTQVNNVGRLDPGFGQKRGAESEDFVENRVIAARFDAKVITQINQAVARLKTVGEMVMEGLQTVNIAMNG